MINSIYIQNFRGLKDLKIENLKRIKLIEGENNSGKISLLRAIFIY